MDFFTRLNIPCEIPFQVAPDVYNWQMGENRDTFAKMGAKNSEFYLNTNTDGSLYLKQCHPIVYTVSRSLRRIFTN